MPRIEEVANATSRSKAPGWAYVADSGVDPSKTAINPMSSKRRTRNEGHASGGGGIDTTSRQERAVQRRLRELENDESSRDIKVPERKGKGQFHGRENAKVRKIFESGKRFNHLLDDEEADIKNKGRNVPSSATERSKRPSTSRHETPATLGQQEQIGGSLATVAPHPLLSVNVPAPPTQEELDALLAAPPLSWNAARAAPPPENAPPPRRFCDTCGYWGRIKCMKCGARVCGLECKNDHAERCTPFG